MSDLIPTSSASTSVAVADGQRFIPRPAVRAEKALSILRSFGLPVPNVETSQSMMANLLRDLAVFGEEHTVAVLRTLGHAEAFNKVVLENTNQVSLSDRYVKVAKAFKSIRDDAKRMAQQVEDGKLSVSERLSNSWMEVSRGSIPKRFTKIREEGIAVHRDSEISLSAMKAIFEAYVEYRAAIQEARILVQDIRELAEQKVSQAKEHLRTVNAELEVASTGSDARHFQVLQLKRDEAVHGLQDADRRYQIAEDLHNNLSNSYHTTEVLMVRLQQTYEAQQRMYQQSVSFFSTNEAVLSTLSASFVMLQSLHESTQVHKVMKDGIKESLETLADTGTKVQEEAVRQGYGPTVDVSALTKLVDAIVSYEKRSIAIKEEARAAAKEAQRAAEEVAERGKRDVIRIRSEG